LKSIIVSPHDKIVKASLSNVSVAREYFQHNLPKEVLDVIDLGVLTPCPTLYVNKHLKASESDIVYETVLKGTGDKCYIRIAHEHQSTHSD
jgi:hypothetical protein